MSDVTFEMRCVFLGTREVKTDTKLCYVQFLAGSTEDSFQNVPVKLVAGLEVGQNIVVRGPLVNRKFGQSSAWNMRPAEFIPAEVLQAAAASIGAGKAKPPAAT